MILSYLKKNLGFFIMVVAIIAVYKTFDNFSSIIDWLKTLSKLLTPFFISFAIAYLLYPPCKKIEALFKKSKFSFFRKRCRGLAIFCVYFACFVVLGMIFSFLIPIAVESISDLIDYLPVLIPNIVHYVQNFNFYGINLETIMNTINVDAIVAQLDLANINKYAEGVVAFSSTLFNVIMGVIISVYILLDRSNLRKGVIRIANLYIKPSTAIFAKKYIHSINTFVYKYIVCQFADALIVFVLMLITFSIFRVKYAAALAAFLGVFNLIPYFGAIISGVAVVIITAFTSSPTTAIIVAVAILVLQQLDANIINPAIVKDQLDVKPFWIILGILVGGAFFGPLGVFFAAPVMALLKLMLDDYLSIKESLLVVNDNVDVHAESALLQTTDTQ